MDIRIEAIRADHLIGRGTCSMIDECISDAELVTELDACGAELVTEAVAWARGQQRLWLMQGANASNGDADCPLVRDYDEFLEAERHEFVKRELAHLEKVCSMLIRRNKAGRLDQEIDTHYTLITLTKALIDVPSLPLGRRELLYRVMDHQKGRNRAVDRVIDELDKAIRDHGHKGGYDDWCGVQQEVMR